MRRNPLCRLLLLLMLGAGALPVMAGYDDTQQPIHIEADRAEVDEPRGVMTYSGHVVLRQGGIQVQADTLVVYSKDGELQRITAQGQPVRYWQQATGGDAKTEGTKKEVRGESQRLEYNTGNKQVLLLGQAEFWQGGNRFSGNRIQYDSAAERVIANAGGVKGADGAAPRVSVTLQPRKKKAPSSP
ncbi:MAG TPA: lipopolysaccharide transport periplasmic protein LptA [Gammaproteobacteria bacterium]|nr:lipopolysaccharide transport periplasmic protein LptA [Gammaproteobacteria bacterium]